MSSINKHPALATGERLYNPLPGEEVVISGIAGRYPQCDSLYELQDSLVNKGDLITDDARLGDIPEILQKREKFENLEKFDASFFGISDKQANFIDPGGRKLLETCYEAIVDAGLTPSYFKGSSTGVFVGASFFESDYKCSYANEENSYGIPGCGRFMLANRISAWLDINGPSYAIDTACSSSLFALDHAFKAIRDGYCAAAIVGGVNLCLTSCLSWQFSKVDVLSPEGQCKCLDGKANAGSESISVILLQKKKHAKRVYGTIIHSKINYDGFKKDGIAFPSEKPQSQLVQDMYEECGVLPKSVIYVGPHRIGTQAGDSVETYAVDGFFSQERTKPLPTESVKGNLEYCEGAAGLCSIAKACIAFETGSIPSNINYNTPLEGAGKKRKVNVVAQNTPLVGNLIGVSSYGFGGADCHVLLKRNKKTKAGNPFSSIPYLVVVSGRTVDAISCILDDLSGRRLDPEFIRLVNDSHQVAYPGHRYRGHVLLIQDETDTPECISREINVVPETKWPLWFVFPGEYENCNIGRDLMKMQVFRTAIERCHQTLLSKGINVKKIVTGAEETSMKNKVRNSLIRTTAIQIGLVDTLRAVGINPDYIIGHSAGELGSAYADGCLTAPQTILAAYVIGQSSDPFALNSTQLQQLQDVVPCPVERSDRWISASSVRKLCSAEYLMDSVLNTVSLEHLCSLIPNNAILVEVGPLVLPQYTLKKLLGRSIVNVTLTDKVLNDNTDTLMRGLGR